MTRVLSALVLVPIVLGIVVFLPAWATVVFGAVVLVLAMGEYMHLVGRDDAASRTLATMGALVAYLGLSQPSLPLEVPLLAATIAVAASAVASLRPDIDVIRIVATTLMPVLYPGLALGALAAIRVRWGAEPLLLLLATIMASDIAQYYGGRAFGRRPLAPVISPKKTIEGGVCGIVAGAIAFVAGAYWWLPPASTLQLAMVGVTLVAAGIVGDLFESLLKRSAGVKDASALIPGHGGVLDRLDSLLLAGPVFYVVLNYAWR